MFTQCLQPCHFRQGFHRIRHNKQLLEFDQQFSGTHPRKSTLHHELMILNQQSFPNELLDLLSFRMNAVIGYLDDNTFNEVVISFKAVKVLRCSEG